MGEYKPWEERLQRNDKSRVHASHHFEPWTQGEDEILVTFYDEEHTDDMLAEISETLGRTIEACRQRYHIVKRADRVTYVTRTTTAHKGQSETVTRTVERRRPPMDDLTEHPEWYV